MAFIHVPAMRGKMGTRTYYSCLLPLSSIPSLFKFTDWAGFTPEDREQRILNVKRVPDLRDYVLENEDDYIFASITASYKSEPVFEVQKEEGAAAIGILKLKLGDELVINDGQHRAAGIAAAIKENPAIGEHTISILLFPWENKDRVQQMFSDLNRFVQKTSKSLDILYDKRDETSAATLEFIKNVPVFRELTEKDDASLKAKSTKLFTLAALYDASKEVLKGREDASVVENAAILTEFWQEVAKLIPDWERVLKGQKMSQELRAESISAHSTVLRAIGGIGGELIGQADWQQKLAPLASIDWSRKNPEWEGICIVANSVVSNRQARSATRSMLKFKLGLPMTDAEKNSLKSPAQVAKDLLSELAATK